MNQEKFEEAYIRANAQIAFVIAEGQTKLYRDAMSLARSRARKGATKKEISREASRLVGTELFTGQATDEYKREHGGEAPTLGRIPKVSRTSKGRPVRKLEGPRGPLPG